MLQTIEASWRKRTSKQAEVMTLNRYFAARLNSGVRRLHALMKQLTPEVLAEAVTLGAILN
jgi:hypothetical protein